ncbi:MAG: pyrimidine reductase family protein [Acidimicrobiia bacterium]|nr:pyrimidine reductase family protein [Acidimicrobiia bacterium]
MSSPTPMVMLPDGLDEVAAVVRAEERRSTGDRPWVTLNMITSVDGAAALDGRSGGLGHPADKAVFRALRAMADAVLVGAGTVRAERYGPVVLNGDLEEIRLTEGQLALPRVVVVSGSGDLDPELPLFGGNEPTPLVVTTTSGAATVRRILGDRTDLVAVGEDTVDLARALAELGDLGLETILCEGGPSLNGQLVADGLVDELCVSVAPLLVGGDASRIVEGAPEALRSATLARGFVADGLLALRYLFDR